MQKNFNDWKDRLQALAVQASQDDGAHDMQHLNRVWHTASTLLESTPQADRLVVLVACFLHDLVNVPKNHPDRARASRLAAQEARCKLEYMDFPSDKIDAVVHAI